MANITLINPNLIQVPAVAPVALDVLNTSLCKEGHNVDLLDLTPVAKNFPEEIERYFSKNNPNFVGITFRNAWDMVFNSVNAVPDDGSFVPSHVRVTKELLKYLPKEKIIVGGVGFSSIPHYILEQTGLKFGVVGAGDKVFGRIINFLERGQIPYGLEGFVEVNKPYIKSPREETVNAIIDRKNFVDNKWYFKHGGLAGLRTSNGCELKCAYCFEPEVKGGIFLRKPEQVLGELDQLVEQGINDIHIIDSEANLPFEHSKRIKRAIIERGYPSNLRIWEYAQIKPFDEEYAILAKKSGVAGILFSTDHSNTDFIKAFGKNYTKEDIKKITEICKDNGIKVMHELLFGLPRETEDTIKQTIDFFRELDPYLTGITLGIGITPGSPLSKAESIIKTSHLSSEERKKQGVYCKGKIFCEPTYYISPNLKIPKIYEIIMEYVGDDIYRFMVPTVQSISNTDNQLINSQRIGELIREGKTGAYWSYYRDQWR